MKNKLPIKRENNFFDKLKNWFRDFFKMTDKAEISVKVAENNIEKVEQNITKESVDNNWIEQDKEKVSSKRFSNISTKQQFIRQIEKNPELLDGLSIDRLEIIDNYCDEMIKKAKVKLNKLLKI